MARPKSSLTPPKVVVSPANPTELTDKQAAYVDARASGLNKQDSAGLAGYAHPAHEAKNLEKLPKITQSLLAERAKNAYMIGMTRDKVLQGMLDAVTDAKILADPMSQIAGWREIAKICGFYAPEVRQIQLTGPTARVLERMQELSDEELLQIAQSDVIDVEAIEKPSAENGS